MGITAKKITELLYTKNGLGCCRCGCYTVDKYLFLIAIKNYIRTGENQLLALDIIYYASWYKPQIYRGKLMRKIINDDEKKILEDYLSSKGFWSKKINTADIDTGSIKQYLFDGVN